MLAEHYLRHDELKEMIPVLAYDDDRGVFWLEDNALAFGFISSPLPGADDSAGDRLQLLLNQNWDKGTMVQVMLLSSPDIIGQMQRFMDIREESVRARRMKRHAMKLSAQELQDLEEQDELILNLARRQVQFWTDGSNRPILERDRLRVNDTNVVITVRMPIYGKQPTEDEIIKASNKADQISSTLRSSGLAPIKLTPELWMRTMQIILNPTSNAPWRSSARTSYDPSELLRDQCLDPGLSVHVAHDGLDLPENKRIKFLCIKRLPEQAYFGMAREYLADMETGSRGLRENSFVFCTIYFGDAEADRSKIGAERGWVTQQAFGPMLKFSPRLAHQKASFDAIGAALDDGDRPVHVFFGVGLCVDKKDEAQSVANAISYMRERHFTMLEEKYITLPSLMNALPLCADPKAVKVLGRFKRMATRHATCMLPIFGDWKGTVTPSMPFVSRSGQLMTMSIFDSPTSYNGLVIASSGSGKSVLANFLATNTLALGGRTWVIDVGKSYEKLCRSLHGQFVSFERGSKICLNPFPKVQDYIEEADILLGLVLAMAFNTGKPDDYQISGVRKHMNDLWALHKQQMTIDLIAESLSKDPDPRLADIGYQLFAFTSRGEYGAYFNGENNVQFDNSFVVVELEELKSRNHLQKVVLLQLIYQIQQECYLGERSQQKVVMIDEGWSLLTEGEVGKFIEGAYRRFRKYGAAAIVITQGIDDLYNSPNGAAITANSPNMFLLKQKGEVIEKAREAKRLSMPDGAYPILKSVHTVPEAYSEIFFMNELGMGVGKLILDPYSNLLYSTRSQHVQAIDQLRAKGLTLDQSIRHLLGDQSVAHELEQQRLRARERQAQAA